MGHILISRDCLISPQLKMWTVDMTDFSFGTTSQSQRQGNSLTYSSEPETDNKFCGKYLLETVRNLLFWKALLCCYFQTVNTAKGLLAELSWLLIKKPKGRKRDAELFSIFFFFLDCSELSGNVLEAFPLITLEISSNAREVVLMLKIKMDTHFPLLSF